MGPISLGLSELPGLPGSLFPSFYVFFFWCIDLSFYLELFFFLSLHTCCVVRGRALGIHQGGAIHITVLCGGEGSEQAMLLAPLFASVQSLYLLPTSKLGPSGAILGWMVLCMF